MVAVATDEKTPLLKQPHYDASPADATPPSFTPSLSDESFGYLLLLGSALGFSFLFFITRLVVGYRSFPVSSVLLIRGAIQSAFALVSIAAFSSFGKSFSLTRSQVAVVALRGAAGGLMLSLNYFALRVLPYGTFASIFFISTLFLLPFPLSALSFPI